MIIKALYVADLICPEFYICHSEVASLFKAQICRKSKTGYIQLATGIEYTNTNELGINRVDKRAIYPLSDYYYSIGLKKMNNHFNKKEVYENVKKLKKRKIL